MPPVTTDRSWSPVRPRTLVVACSDGRLQEATDDFLARALRVAAYDRLYLPGGGGALIASGRDFLRAQQQRRECRFLVEAHDVREVVLLFHGPAPTGPAAATCADYRRKLPWATVAQLRAQQRSDARELVERRAEWAGDATVHVWRCEVAADASLDFVPLDAWST